jgi:hypothetical protein
MYNPELGKFCLNLYIKYYKFFSQKYRENGRLDSASSVYVPAAQFNKKK